MDMRDDVRVGGGPHQGGRRDTSHGQGAEHRQQSFGIPAVAPSQPASG